MCTTNYNYIICMYSSLSAHTLYDRKQNKYAELYRFYINYIKSLSPDGFTAFFCFFANVLFTSFSGEKIFKILKRIL